MQTLKELIERHASQHSEFRYYIPIFEKAESNEIEHPDITIECCSSLLQGISKSIVHRLDPACDKAQLERETLPQQVKCAVKCLMEHDDVVEIEFVRACETLARVAGTLRNTRGDISHGRAVPKELQSDRSLARLVLSTTEASLRYMLASFFAIAPEVEPLIEYKENEEFNDFLDEKHPLDGKLLYSRALFDQSYNDYKFQMDEFLEVRDSEG